MSDNDTIFGKILRGEIPCDRVHEDDLCIAFRDISPAAPTHILVIPRQPIRSTNEMSSDQKELVGHLVHVAAQIARDQGIAESGYRLVINCNDAGGQTVYHLHVHLLGGRPMTWPPG